MIDEFWLLRERRRAVPARLPRVLLSLAWLCVFLAPRASYGGGATPIVTSVSPSSGPEGTLVTITGSNFNNTTAVHFGGIAAAFTYISPTTVTATVPGGFSGSVNITVSALFVGTSATNPGDLFTLQAAAISTPALNWWSLIALALLLVCFGWFALRRKFV
jgi:hypothetical protein